MYLKLTFRNISRCLGNYLLFAATLGITAILLVFSCLFAAVSEQSGLQAASLPLLITLTAVFLLNYIHGFILRQRSKELATYTLLGMEQNKIAYMFFLESLVISILVFTAGSFLGCLIFTYFFSAMLKNPALQFPSSIPAAVYYTAGVQTLFYFFLMELCIITANTRRILRLKVISLLTEGRRNETPAGKKSAAFWLSIFSGNMAVFLILLSVIAFSADMTAFILSVSMISIPLLLSVFSFHKTLYCVLQKLRVNRPQFLYKGNRLYLASHLLSRIHTGSSLNASLSVCLLFSVLSFIIAMAAPFIPETYFDTEQLYQMSFLQFSICLLFLILYFSILSVRQLTELQTERREWKLLLQLGMSRGRLSFLLLSQIFLRFLLPFSICFLLLCLFALFISGKVDLLLHTDGFLCLAAASFFAWYFILCVLYAVIVFISCRRHLKLF